MSARADAEGKAVRVGVIVAAVVVAAQLGGGIGYAVVHEDPSPRALALACLLREKQLAVRAEVLDPVAPRASGGALATDVEGNGVVALFASSAEQASELLRAYESDPAAASGRIETRGRVVLVFHRAASPTQRQTMYDCVG